MNRKQSSDKDSTASKDVEGLSAIVINYNGGSRVIKTLQALVDQQTSFDHILVVDNGSTDGSNAQIASNFPQVEVLELAENRGLPVARNVGLAHVNTSRVLLIDNDLYLHTDGLGQLVEAMNQTQATVVCPRVRLFPNTDIVQADGAASHFLGTMTLRHGHRPVETLDTDRAEVDGCIGACMLVDRKAVIDAGGFNELFFFYFEDLEFCIRMRALGHRFVCEPAAIIDHDRGDGTPGLSFRGRGRYPARRLYLSQRHRLLTILIHYRLRTLILLFPVFLLYELPSLLLSIRMGAPGAWVRAWWWQIAHRRIIRQWRQQMASKRIRHDKDIFTGGPIPLAPGVVHSRLVGAVIGAMSATMNGYWRLARPFIG